MAEFPYCRDIYKDALKTPERKFGQPQAEVTAYFDKLANIPQVKMHNSDSIITYSATVSLLVDVFRSLIYNRDLSSASQLSQKFPPNMKEAWSMHTVKHNLDQLTLVDLKYCLKVNARAHGTAKTISRKTKIDENTRCGVTKPKTTSKILADTTSTNQRNSNSEAKSDNAPANCVAYKKKHLLWRCPLLRKKTHTERVKVVADNQLCFFCFNDDTPSDSVQNRRKVPKRDAEVPITHSFMESPDYFPTKTKLLTNENQRHQQALKEQR